MFAPSDLDHIGRQIHPRYVEAEAVQLLGDTAGTTPHLQNVPTRHPGCERRQQSVLEMSAVEFVANKFGVALGNGVVGGPRHRNMLLLGHSGYGTGSPGVGRYECVSISKKCPVGSRKYTPRPPWSVLTVPGSVIRGSAQCSTPWSTSLA